MLIAFRSAFSAVVAPVASKLLLVIIPRKRTMKFRLRRIVIKRIEAEAKAPEASFPTPPRRSPSAGKLSLLVRVDAMRAVSLFRLMSRRGPVLFRKWSGTEVGSMTKTI